MSLVSRLSEVGSLYPDKEAIVYDEKRITYGSLIEHINRFCQWFKKLWYSKRRPYFNRSRELPAICHFLFRYNSD